LPNRLLLADRLDQALADTSRGGHGVAVMFLDLDRFKEVNDTHGHATGDALLKALTLGLQDCLRGGDTLARLGGDEFVIVLPNIASAKDAVAVAEKILAFVSRPIELPGVALQSGVSIGIALYPACGANPAELMRAADDAMYRAKQEGRNTYRLCERAIGDASCTSGPCA